MDIAIVDSRLTGNEPAATTSAANHPAGDDLIGRLLRTPPADARPMPGPAYHSLPDPVRLGRRMAALYATWQRRRRPDLERLAGVLMRRHAIAPDSPLGGTCLAAARAVNAWGGLPYHSATHHAEVATNAMVLLEIADRQGHRVGTHAAATLLAACLAHDLHYLPSVARKRFAAETVSADALDAFAVDNGCDAADRQTLRALVIATEPGLRLRAGGPLGAPLDPTVVRLLQRLAVDPALSRLAAILSDADLLSSVGLTPAWYRVQQGRLEREAGRHHRAEENRRFFAMIVGPDFLSEPGRLFTHNLAIIRKAVC